MKEDEALAKVTEIFKSRKVITPTSLAEHEEAMALLLEAGAIHSNSQSRSEGGMTYYLETFTLPDGQKVQSCWIEGATLGKLFKQATGR